MAFDKKAYQTTVLKSLAKDKARRDSIKKVTRSLNQAPGDRDAAKRALAGIGAGELLAVEGGMTDESLKKHLSSLQGQLNAMSVPTVKDIAPLLKAVLGVEGSGTTAFWSEVESLAGAAAQEQVAAFVAALAQSRALRVVSPDELRELAKKQGVPATVSDRSLASSARKAGLLVVAPIEVPLELGPTDPLHPKKLRHFRSLLDVLAHPGGGELERDAAATVVDALSIGGKAFGTADLAKAKSVADARPSTDEVEEAKKVLNAMAMKAERSDARLHDVVLAWFFAETDRQLKTLGMDTSVVSHLVGLGLADVDARRLVASRSTGGNGPTGPTLDEVTEQLAHGHLAEARRLIESIPATDENRAEHTALSKRVTARENDKRAAMADYRKALDAGDLVVAEERLRAAESIDVDDSTIAPLLEQLPPAPPTHVLAQADAAGVAVTWHGSKDLEYVLVRSASGVPGSPEGGHQVAAGSGLFRGVDSAAPAATSLTYAVFARRRTGAVSLAAAAAPLVVLPAPSGASAATTESDAVLTWTVPDSATRVIVELVTHRDGSRRNVPTSGRGRAQLTGLRLGERYSALLTAEYLVDGVSHRSAAVSVPVTPRGTARLVNDLVVEPADLPNGTRGYRAAWGAVAGFETVLWVFPVDDAPRSGRADIDSLRDGAGRPVQAAIRPDGERETCLFSLGGPSGGFYSLHAVTLTDEDSACLISEGHVVGEAPAPKDARTERRGDELVVSWTFPNRYDVVEAAWTDHDGASTSRRVSRSDYNKKGGLRLAKGASIRRVTLATVVAARGGEYVSSPIDVPVAESSPVVPYQLEIRSRFMRGTEVTVELNGSEVAGLSGDVVLVSSTRNLPATVESGRVLARLTADFSGSTTFQVTTPIEKPKGAFWVRLLPAPGCPFLLKDPSTRSLKGK